MIIIIVIIINLARAFIRERCRLVDFSQATPSLEPRLSVPDFVSQLGDKIRNGEPGFEAKPHPLQ